MKLAIMQHRPRGFAVEILDFKPMFTTGNHSQTSTIGNVLPRWREYLIKKEAVVTTTEKLYQTVQDLPEPALAELLDFAEFLRTKSTRKLSSGKSLIELSGGLENSATFAGDALEIQRQIRNEWH